MNPLKLQSLQKFIIDQSGQQRLILNDLILGLDGANVVASMIPQYHSGIHHIEIKGNNLDAEAFELILTSLLHCQYLKSIMAEWNTIGSSQMGLAALAHLTRTLHYLELIDLKNNRICHHLTPYLADIIKANQPNLKVLDLRWNELGQLGAQGILAALPQNQSIKFIGLQDNQISTGMLMQIQTVLKRGQRILRHSSSMPGNFPITMNDYPSMDAQLKTGEIRSKIDQQQRQTDLNNQKIEVEIQKILQKVKLRGAQIHELQLKHDSLVTENMNITNQLRESERILTLEKEKMFGLQRNLNQQKSNLRVQKYKINSNIQAMMEKYTQKYQREMEELELVMNQKLDRLNIFLKERLHEKRSNRDKLSDIKEDILKYKMNKEEVWNKVGTNSGTMKTSWMEECVGLEDLIAKSKSTVQTQLKKGNYMTEQLINLVLRALRKEENYEGNIYSIQEKIKALHNEMALKNLQMETNLSKIRIMDSQIIHRQVAVQMRIRYLRYIQTQANINLQVQGLKQHQHVKGSRVGDQSLQIRIIDVQKAIRSQQTQNKMLKNQYQKMRSHIEAITKKNIQATLFQ